MIEVLCKDKHTGEYYRRLMPVDDILSVLILPVDNIVVIVSRRFKRKGLKKNRVWVEVGESFDDVKEKILKAKNPLL